jgi:hypothetical protein
MTTAPPDQGSARPTHFASGAGTCIAGPTTIVLLDLPPTHDLVVELSGPGLHGESLAALASILARRGFERLPTLACIGMEHGAVNVLVRGDAVVEVNGGDRGSSRIDGAGVLTWREASIEGNAVTVRLRGSEATPTLSLLGGVVPADVVRVVLASAASIAAPPMATPPTPPPAAPPPPPRPVAAPPPVAVPPPTVQPPVGVTVDSPARTPGANDARPPPTEPVRAPSAAPASTDRRAQSGLDSAAGDTTAEETRVFRESESAGETPEDDLTAVRIGDMERSGWPTPGTGPPRPSDAGAVLISSVPGMGPGAVEEPLPVVAHSLVPPTPRTELPETPVSLTDADENAATVQRAARLEPPRTGGGPPGTTAGPTVRSVHCPARHPNPPHGELCRTCGQPIADRTVTTIVRPPLGRLRLPDGRVIELSHPVVLGRRPPEDLSIDGEPAQSIRLPDDDKVLSRVHAEVRLVDWQVQVVDRDSMNHTFVELPGHPPMQLRPAEPFPIPLGAIVNLGDSVRIELLGAEP